MSEARKRGLAADKIPAPMEIDPKARNQLTIEGHRCEVLPGRMLEPDEGRGKGKLRLHPAFGWPSEFLIYVVNGLGLFVLPATDSTIGGAWSIDARSLERYKNGWHVFAPFEVIATSRRQSVSPLQTVFVL